jgi:fumarate hydratase, class I
MLGKITEDGIFVEKLETNPAKYLPEVTDDKLSAGVVRVDLNKYVVHISVYLYVYEESP